MEVFLMKLERFNCFFEGRTIEAYKLFGAHKEDKGIRFTVYAPNAKNVQVSGEFNGWNGACGWMEKIDERGVWSTYIPNAKEYQLYNHKHPLLNSQG